MLSDRLLRSPFHWQTMNFIGYLQRQSKTFVEEKVLRTFIPCRSVRSSLEKQIQTVQYLLYLPLLVGSLTYKRGVQVGFFCFSINEDGTFNFA